MVNANRSIKVSTRWVCWLITFMLVSIIGAVGFVGVSPAHAESVNAATFIGKNDGLVQNIVTTVNKNQGVEILEYEQSDGILEFNNTLYSQMDNDAKQEYMETALDAVNDSDLNAQRKNKMYNFIAEQDTTVSEVVTRFSRDAKADSAGAFALLSPFQKGFSIFLGVIAVITAAFLSLSILADSAYLTIPLLTSFVDSKNSRPWWVSLDAHNARQVSENSMGSGNFRTAMWEYLKSRWIGIFITVFLIFLLVTGRIYDIVAFVGTVFGF